MFLINLSCAILLITNCVMCYIPYHRPYGITQYTSGSATYAKGLSAPSIVNAFHSKHDAEPESAEENLHQAPFAPGKESFLPADNEPSENDVNSIDLLKERIERIKEEEDIEIKSSLLMKLLEELPDGPLPVVYIEDESGSLEEQDVASPEFTSNSNKRSGRYYRRYPWKRQNARSRTYDADARYLCVPSREDVFKLLVGLHENRNGNQHKTINFCNRKRPAKAIFTNIRFLG